MELTPNIWPAWSCTILKNGNDTTSYADTTLTKNSEEKKTYVADETANIINRSIKTTFSILMLDLPKILIVIKQPNHALKIETIKMTTEIDESKCPT